MAQLAILGHATRGNEVIEILEMLGGKNERRFNGENNCLWHYINERSEISVFTHVFDLDDFIFFTLEEFLEKFPYKVGDKVLYKTYGIYSKIKTMLWNAEKERVFYRLESNKLFVATADELQSRKEEIMGESTKAIFEGSAQCCDIMNDIIKKDMEEKRIDIPKGYEFAGIDDNAQQVVFTKIGYHYPKTYEECYDILGLLKPKNDDSNIFGYRTPLLSKFQKLLVCRDAYWKIAGEQMGFDKPWEPDWTNPSEKKYCITNTEGNITIEWVQTITNKILVFPTAEIRDAFKENFDDDIEFCKEFL